MKNDKAEVWKYIFGTIIIAYGLYYAPYGVNETDGGFLTGLAWQLLNGKVLYNDIVYVRPPLPVWLRAMEIRLLPDQWAILGERWIFYGKLALYAYLGAALFYKDQRRWILSTLGFVVSAHCYPSMAWHTVDGILFAVLATYFLSKDRMLFHFLAGAALFGSLLCKQSFYPLLPVFLVFAAWDEDRRWVRLGWFCSGLLLCSGLFFYYLYLQNSLSGFLQMTGGAASGGQALQHGILDYFRITPELSIPGLILLFPVVRWFQNGQKPVLAYSAWLLWLFALPLSYAGITWIRHEHTVPFAQSRAMFWIAALLFTALLKESRGEQNAFFQIIRSHTSFLILMAISWCASVSWGYNLPILLATPWIWAAMEISAKLEQEVHGVFFERIRRQGALGLLLLLLIAFRVGHEFVYRDGWRSDMPTPMGAIFPQLSGIYSDKESAELYQDLKRLVAQYGPNFKVLPAFPQANFLTRTRPPLPLDWVVNRETNGDNRLVLQQLEEKKPVVFIQKSFLEKINQDPELEITRMVFQNGKILEETPFFRVVSLYQQ